jgi:hypothetical protein
MSTPYPGYDVLARWESASYDDVTRRVLRERMKPPAPPRYLAQPLYAVLEAACSRVVPQPDRSEPVPIAPWIDRQLRDGGGEGYRAPGAPPQRKAWETGLAGLDREARRRHCRGFAVLDGPAQDGVLRSLQDGTADGAAFPGLDARRFLIEMLAKTAAAIYYGHPAAWSEIGFGGPASPRGYVRIGLDERDPWEPPLAPAPVSDRAR